MAIRTPAKWSLVHTNAEEGLRERSVIGHVGKAQSGQYFSTPWKKAGQQSEYVSTELTRILAGAKIDVSLVPM